MLVVVVSVGCILDSLSVQHNLAIGSRGSNSSSSKRAAMRVVVWAIGVREASPLA